MEVPQAERGRSTPARIAERCATAAPDTSFAWNVYQHRRWLIIIPRASACGCPVARSARCLSRRAPIAKTCGAVVSRHDSSRDDF